MSGPAVSIEQLRQAVNAFRLVHDGRFPTCTTTAPYPASLGAQSTTVSVMVTVVSQAPRRSVNGSTRLTRRSASLA